MVTSHPWSIAVVGAGLAGSTCASALLEQGHSVHVFDKSRGAGGRLSTRRFEWLDVGGQSHRARLDHGAVGFAARSPAFQSFVARHAAAGRVAEWSPSLRPGSLPLEPEGALFVPTPDMPALCRHLLDGTTTRWSFAVDRMCRDAHVWWLEAAGERHPVAFDAVVLAVPPAQAAPLLAEHRADWARHACIVPMQPCWTLMGVAEEDALPDWAVSRPPVGPLAWIVRSDLRPARERVPGQAHWVAHARPGWSRQHLEQPADWVKSELCAAMAESLGQAPRWVHAAVHRWRYALPMSAPASPAMAALHWWDPVQGLGVCGDFMGHCGVEGAYLSALALAAALAQVRVDATAPS